jgi:hypothetical protein
MAKRKSDKRSKVTDDAGRDRRSGLEKLGTPDILSANFDMEPKQSLVHWNLEGFAMLIARHRIRQIRSRVGVDPPGFHKSLTSRIDIQTELVNPSL